MRYAYAMTLRRHGTARSRPGDVSFADVLPNGTLPYMF
jgi:hypothetical protein